MKKSITLWGYAAANLGDDLFFQTLVRRYPEVCFYQYAKREYKSEYWEEENIKIVSTWRKSLCLRLPMSYLRRGGENGAQVVVGGSIFQDDEYWKNNILHYHKILSTGQPTFVMGSNVGPIRAKSFTGEVEGFFKGCESVTLRDKFSKDLFSNLSHVYHVPDMILTREEQSEKNPKSIGISVMDLGESYLNTLADWVEEAKQMGYSITLFSFSRKLGDERAIEKLLQKLKDRGNLGEEPRKAVKVHYYKGDITQTLKRLGKMETMIASRFHATILGIVFNQKIFSIIYGGKTANVLADLPHKIPSVCKRKVHTISFQEILEKTQNQPFDWAQTKKQAHMHFQALDQWVKGE